MKLKRESPKGRAQEREFKRKSSSESTQRTLNKECKRLECIHLEEEESKQCPVGACWIQESKKFLSIHHFSSFQSALLLLREMGESVHHCANIFQLYSVSTEGWFATLMVSAALFIVASKYLNW